MTVTKSVLSGCFGVLAGLAMLSLGGQAASAQTYGLATMQPGTLAHTVASAIAKTLKEKGGLNTLVQNTAGELVLIPMVAKGEIDLGMANMLEVVEGIETGKLQNDLRIIGSIYVLRMGFFARKDSGDGYGSGLAGSVSVGRGGAITRLNGIEYPHSLGTFYESVTSALGFKPSRHEGKIVGLAAYGDPAVLQDVLLARFDLAPGAFRIRESNNLYFARMLASEFPKIDVAAAYQHVLELVATAYVGALSETDRDLQRGAVRRRRRQRQAEPARSQHRGCEADLHSSQHG